MSASSLLKYLYLAYVSRPDADRRLYRTIRRNSVRNIVELGVGDALRAQRMLSVAARYQDLAEITYTGIDLFEAREDDSPGLSLKETHKQISTTGVRPKLVPGDPFSALSRTANTLLGTDLLVIAADQDASSLERAWFYVPRLLHADSVVLVEHQAPGEDGERRYHRLPATDIDQLARLATPRHQASRRAA